MKKRIVFYILIILTLLFSACGKSTKEKWQEQYDLGQQYLLEENYEEAIVAFTAAIEIDPKQADTYLERGDAYILSGETEENLTQALADYRHVLEMSETNASAYLGVADVYIRQGDYDAALEILNEGLEKTEENEEIAAKIEEIESGNITDSSGNTRRMSSYDASGNLVWYHECTYNAEGQQITVTSYDGAGNETGHLDLSYNEKGLPTISYVYGFDKGILEKRLLTYDDSGNLIREDASGHYTLFQYDSKGNCVLEETHDANDDQIYLTHRNEYDSQGKLIKIDVEGSRGQSSGCYSFEYDKEGKLLKQAWDNYDHVELSSQYIYKYDENGFYIEMEEYDYQGNLVRTYTN